MTLGSNLTICLPESRFCNYLWVSWGELGEMTILANVYWLLYVCCRILIPQHVCEDRLFYFLFDMENCGAERLSQGPGAMHPDRTDSLSRLTQPLQYEDTAVNKMERLYPSGANVLKGKWTILK